jgi:hypothetical protein
VGLQETETEVMVVAVAGSYNSALANVEPSSPPAISTMPLFSRVAV